MTCAVRAKRAPQPGYVFSRRAVPPELVLEIGTLRLTDPALTTLDLIDALGGDAIDHALRTKATTLTNLRNALELTANRRGNHDRRVVLLESRDEPWSAPERQLHRGLRAAGITGWTANRTLIVAGRAACPDIRFPAERLVVEVDGREFHTEAEVFENDRWRQNLLQTNGWLVLRYTWRMIQDDLDGVVAQIAGELRRRARA